MAKEFSYKKTTLTKLQAIGFLDTDKLTIEVEGETRDLADLLKDFNGTNVTFAVSVKEEKENEE
jgi:predicted solute-binding protein